MNEPEVWTKVYEKPDLYRVTMADCRTNEPHRSLLAPLRTRFHRSVCLSLVRGVEVGIAALIAALLLVSATAKAAPTLITVDCDGSGEYTCLTRIENFVVGAQRYEGDFVQGNVLDVFGVDTSGGITQSLLDPLEGAIFWGDLAGARAFAGALAGLLEDKGIDGFLCTAVSCSGATSSTSYGVTYIPVYLQATGALPVVELASCFAGTNSTGIGISFCFNPGSNNQNWAVITAVPESSGATLVLAAGGSMGLAVLAWGWGNRSRRGRPGSRIG